MRRLAVVLGFAALLGLTPLVAPAQISIAGNSEVMDISLRDAEIGEVLIALFNTTNGKYQLQIGNGVVGRIARLQLTQTPFERALDAVLGTEYSFNKTQLQDGAYLYKISGRQTATPTVPAAGTRTTGTLAPPSSSVGSTSTGGGLAGATDFSSTLSWKTATTPGGATGGTLGGGTATAGTPASDENSYVKLIRLSNLSVESFCDALGVQSMPWISTLGNNNNGNNNNNNNNNNRNNNNRNNRG